MTETTVAIIVHAVILSIAHIGVMYWLRGRG